MSSKIKSILRLLRIRQYYKNFLIFIGAFFSETLLSFSILRLLILGFVLLCCASSINYIINDLKDIENDKNHPEKIKMKPLASGELSKSFAIVLVIILSGIIIFSIVFFVPNWNFSIMLILIILTGQLYNHLFKNYAFLDIIVLALGYLWRALAGCLLINVFISAWLFLAIFEVAFFLVIAKRKGDLLLLGQEKAKAHKKSYDQYSLKLLEEFHTIIAASLFITYALYLILRFRLFADENNSFFRDSLVFLTVPILLYIIMRYMYLTSEKPEIARNTEKAFFDRGIIVAGILFTGILFCVFYFEPIYTLLINYLK